MKRYIRSNTEDYCYVLAIKDKDKTLGFVTGRRKSQGLEIIEGFTTIDEDTLKFDHMADAIAGLEEYYDFDKIYIYKYGSPNYPLPDIKLDGKLANVRLEIVKSNNAV